MDVSSWTGTPRCTATPGPKPNPTFNPNPNPNPHPNPNQVSQRTWSGGPQTSLSSGVWLHLGFAAVTFLDI